MDRGLSRTQWLVLATGVLATSAGIVGTRLASTALGVRLFDNVHWTAAYLAALVVSWLGVARAEGEVKRARQRFALGVASLAVGRGALGRSSGDRLEPVSGTFRSLLSGPGAISLRADSSVHFKGLPSSERRSAALDVFGVFVVALTLTLVLYRPHRDGAGMFTTSLLVLYAVLLDHHCRDRRCPHRGSPLGARPRPGHRSWRARSATACSPWSGTCAPSTARCATEELVNYLFSGAT